MNLRNGHPDLTHRIPMQTEAQQRESVEYHKNLTFNIDMALAGMAHVPTDQLFDVMLAVIEARHAVNPTALEAFAMKCSRRADDMERQNR